MSVQFLRIKANPNVPDTSGFFDLYVPYTNQSVQPGNDSLKKFYDFSVYDYITPRIQPQNEKPVPSLFEGHELQVTGGGPKPIERQPTDWITSLVLLNLLIIAWIQTNHSKRLRQIIRSVALPYYVNQLEREGNLYNERITLGLGVIYLTSVSLLLYQIFELTGLSLSGKANYVTFIIILSGLIGIVMVKAMLVQLAGVIFRTADQTHAYRLNTLIFNQTSGLILFPVFLLSFYWNPFPFIWVGAGFLTIALIYRFLRSLSIGLSNSKFSVFYLILYLCTLEILPVLLLVKLIRQL